MKLTIIKLFLLFLFLSSFIFSCKNAPQENTAKKITIKDKAALDAVLDKYIEEGFYPFVYARLENIDGELIYRA